MFFTPHKRAVALLFILALIPSMLIMAQATTTQAPPETTAEASAVFNTRSVYVTSQRFERGQMYWASDTGTIYVLYDSGRADVFPLSAYGELSDTVSLTPPGGRIRPLFGFARVWANFAAVREGLGWPIWPEIGFTTTIATSNNVVYIKQFNVVPVKITDGSRWEQVIDGKIPGDDVTLSVMVAPETLPPADKFTVTWTMSGAPHVLIEVRDLRMDDKIVFWLDGLPNTGQQTFPLPVDAFLGVQVDVYAYRYESNGSSPSLIERLEQVTTIVTPTTSGTAQTAAAFQPFENGFMIWRADTGMVMVFFKDTQQWREVPEIAYFTLPDNPVTDIAPEGRIKPVSAFGRVWGNIPEILLRLGWATDVERPYTMKALPSADALALYSLPDGSTIRAYGYYWE